MSKQATENDAAYLTDFACAIGRLFGNLLSLELVLRMVLYESHHEPHEPLPAGQGLLNVRIGDLLPLNALTSWDSLGQLIEKYNTLHSARGPDALIDPSIKTLRDMFAHGRILAEHPSDGLTLIRFGKPLQGNATVEGVQKLSVDWVNAQVRLVHDALLKVHGRLREFPGQASTSGVV